MTSPALPDSGITPQIFTKAEAAEILRVKVSWLERKAAARSIPFTMLGGCYHFSAQHLQIIAADFETVPAVQPKSESASVSVSVAGRRRRSHPQPIDPRVVPLRARPRREPQGSKLAA